MVMSTIVSEIVLAAAGIAPTVTSRHPDAPLTPPDPV